MGKFIDLTGQKFGRLTVIERDTSRTGRAYWICKCSCGTVKSICGKNLRNGTATSCGCYNREVWTTKKHGLSHTKVYYTWQGMRGRCFDMKDKRYKNYGGRGITVCDEWRNDFQTFYDYVSKLEHFGEEGYTLDRINNDGNYEPGNVRWATIEEQANNKTDNHYVEVNGEQMTLAQIMRITGAALGTIQDRIRRGWTSEYLLQPPISKHERAPKFDVGGGRQLTVLEIAAETGLAFSSIYRRIQRGWTGEKLLKPARTR